MRQGLQPPGGTVTVRAILALGADRDGIGSDITASARRAIL